MKTTLIVLSLLAAMSADANAVSRRGVQRPNILQLVCPQCVTQSAPAPVQAAPVPVPTVPASPAPVEVPVQ